MNNLLETLNPENSGIFYKPLAHAIGLNESVIFSSLVAKQHYYSKHEMLDDEGFFFSTSDDLQESTSLTRKQQDLAIKKLVALELVESKVKGLPARRHFKVLVTEKLKEILNNGQKISDELKAKTRIDKTEKQVSTKSKNWIEQNVKVNILNKNNNNKLLLQKEKNDIASIDHESVKRSLELQTPEYPEQVEIPEIKLKIKKFKPDLHVIPVDWKPDETGKQYFLDRLAGIENYEIFLEDFVDYWRDRGVMRAGWDGTWKRWIRDVEKRKKGSDDPRNWNKKPESKLSDLPDDPRRW